MERVVIVGAGTFGASLAWQLAGRGDDVVLVDQFAPGDSRASSGGETRLIRCSYGANADYAAMARRARTLWRELEIESGADLMSECGLSGFAHGDEGWEADSERTLSALGIPVIRQSVAEAARQFPSLGGADLAWVLHEPEAGMVRAARAVEALASCAVARGARLVRERATPDRDTVIAGDEVLEADRVVWSCGGWLKGLFGELVNLRVTRQELFFFDGGPAWADAPCWVDFHHMMYGTGDVDALGVKIAGHVDGPPLDPDAELPPATEETERLMRAYAATRFPALADAPLSGSKCCRYELSADLELIAAPHPEHANVWIVGGGSGHGFKHGPAMAERIIAAWHGGEPLPARFALGNRERETSIRRTAN